MPQTSGLTVRQHERAELALSIEFVVHDRHRDQVTFSATSGAPSPHLTHGTAQDVSTGGMGIICAQYLPRMCEGRVRVYDPRPSGTGRDGASVHEVIFEHDAKVRRVTLASHEPSYAVGLAFIDPSPDLEEQVAALLVLVTEARGKGDAGG